MDLSSRAGVILKMATAGVTDDISTPSNNKTHFVNINMTNTSSSSSDSETNNQPESESDDKENKQKKGKKRVRRSEDWVNKKAKILRNSGKAYVSLSKTKKQVLERRVRPPCGDKCRLGCSKKIDNATREQIFRSYWDIGDLQRQREFIVAHTEVIKPKYRYSSTQDYRNLNSAFYFQVNMTRIRVCKTFFKATLDLNDRPIRTALVKKTETGVVKCDLRGKHGNQPTVDPEIKNSIRNFIKAIPKIESHYLRAQTTREFIEGGRSLADLYRDYKEKQVKKQLPFANSVMFNRIFNNEFNISFYIPKKDQCDLCESFKNADEKKKQELFDSYQLHQKEKELSRQEKEQDKHNQNGTHVAVYDLQAVMQIPKALTSSFYYASKINCFNFTISDLQVKNVECYFWNETDGNRGAIEIGSCVLGYIKMIVEKANNSDLDLIFFSDNCCGQQKNKYLLSLYAYAVNKFKLRSITHKFLIHGHSQNEGDNVHSVIEKQIKRHLRASPIYVPEQYTTLIRLAKKKGPPYRVHELTYEDFYDLKILQEEWGNNFTIDSNKQKVVWNNIKVLRVQKNHPYEFFYKTSYEDKEFNNVNVRNTRSSRASAGRVDSLQLVRAYSQKIPLSEQKKKSIQGLLAKDSIKKPYDSFFRNILNL